MRAVICPNLVIKRRISLCLGQIKAHQLAFKEKKEKNAKKQTKTKSLKQIKYKRKEKSAKIIACASNIVSFGGICICKNRNVIFLLRETVFVLYACSRDMQ